MLNDVSGETTALMEMCEALACANVHADVFQEENEKVNRKRRKKNKLPLYETRILTIDVPNIKEHARGKLHGDRSSPRQHLRRGHIRKLSEKKRIWVNSCIVGNKSKGVINKKYEIAR